MDFDLAIRLTEILVAFAFIQQSAEHLKSTPKLRAVFIIRIVLSLALIIGFNTPIICGGLFIITLITLWYFNGPYNGGSDRMGILILSCLCVIHIIPNANAQEYVFGYLAAQVILSYFIAGWVKIANPEWRNGRALQDVFAFSAYPISDSLRAWANHPKTLLTAGWVVILFELWFPFTFLNQTLLLVTLALALIFHCANACLFGFNRFVWIWLASYPSLIWLQMRVFEI